MPDVVIYGQVHQPYRLRKFRVFDIGNGRRWFDEDLNREIVRRVATKCYLPVNRLLSELVDRSDGRFRIALSLTGVVLEQLEAEAPAALDSFRALVDSGAVELLGETFHHSLAGLADPDEFDAQVRLHRAAIRDAFGVTPRVFRNTELAFWDGLAPSIERFGYRGVLVEGADRVLGWRSPNHVYAAEGRPSLRLLPRNYRLSDDIAFRFSSREWREWPLTADKYADWLAASGGDSIHLFVDYETFGEHQWHETGIFDFFRALPEALDRRGLATRLPGEIVDRPPVGRLSFPTPTSWADQERDLSAWLGNRLQRAAHDRLYRLREAVLAAGDEILVRAWRRLTTSDHVYYMSTKGWDDGGVHAYFSPYDTPYDAFTAFMNVVEDLEQAVAAARGARRAARRGPGGVGTALAPIEAVA